MQTNTVQDGASVGHGTLVGPTRSGPAAPGGDELVVSFTEFTARRARDLPAIAREGIRLARGWWAMPGAVRVNLWIEPRSRRGGSLSVWTSEADLRRFVALPRHREIMRRYRGRVDVRAATWTVDRFSFATALADGRARLDAAGS